MPPVDDASAPKTAAFGVPWLDPGAEASALAGALRSAFDRLLSAPLDDGEIPAFEREIAERLGAGDAVAVSSGSDALLAALTALGVGPEDEVITCALGGFAAASAALRLGARPVFVDIDPATLTLDPALVAAAVGDRTRAVVPRARLRTACGHGPAGRGGECLLDPARRGCTMRCVRRRRGRAEGRRGGGLRLLLVRPDREPLGAG